MAASRFCHSLLERSARFLFDEATFSPQKEEPKEIR
jgi:hypothetical protein